VDGAFSKAVPGREQHVQVKEYDDITGRCIAGSNSPACYSLLSPWQPVTYKAHEMDVSSCEFSSQKLWVWEQKKKSQSSLGSDHRRM